MARTKITREGPVTVRSRKGTTPGGRSYESTRRNDTDKPYGTVYKHTTVKGRGAGGAVFSKRTITDTERGKPFRTGSIKRSQEFGKVPLDISKGPTKPVGAKRKK